MTVLCVLYHTTLLIYKLSQVKSSQAKLAQLGSAQLNFGPDYLLDQDRIRPYQSSRCLLFFLSDLI